MTRSPSRRASAAPKVAAAVHPDKAFSHYILGIAYGHYKHDAAAAERHYRKTLELNPRFTFAMVNLAVLLQGKGDVAGMEYWYRKAIETDPKFERPRSNLARSLLNRGDVAGAVAEYRKLIEIAPASAWGHVDLGRASSREAIYLPPWLSIGGPPSSLPRIRVCGIDWPQRNG